MMNGLSRFTASTVHAFNLVADMAIVIFLG